MWLSTHYFSGLLQDWFHVFYMKFKKNSVWYNFYQGTSVSITFYIFEHYQLWMMDSKAQRVFFPKTPKLCVWHTEVRRCYHFKLVSHFQLWFPIWGVLVNRFKPLNGSCGYITNLTSWRTDLSGDNLSDTQSKNTTENKQWSEKTEFWVFIRQRGKHSLHWFMWKFKALFNAQHSILLWSWLVSWIEHSWGHFYYQSFSK